MHHTMISQEMKDCIRVCLDCGDSCLQTVTHCLSKGGRHAEIKHVRLLLDCAAICETSAGFMSRGSSRHDELCGMCAAICRDSAESCRSFDDDDMRRCAEICERCASSCDAMSSGVGTRRATAQQTTVAEDSRGVRSQPFI
jgi:hypothetical protein